jgi:hypothetical protein
MNVMIIIDDEDMVLMAGWRIAGVMEASPTVSVWRFLVGSEYTDVTRICSRIPLLPRSYTRKRAREGLCDILTPLQLAYHCSLREFSPCARLHPELSHFKALLGGGKRQLPRAHARLPQQLLHLRPSWWFWRAVLHPPLPSERAIFARAPRNAALRARKGATFFSRCFSPAPSPPP